MTTHCRIHQKFHQCPREISVEMNDRMLTLIVTIRGPGEPLRGSHAALRAVAGAGISMALARAARERADRRAFAFGNG
eukprot:8699643-Pyramimonas_sp.AAC.1